MGIVQEMTNPNRLALIPARGGSKGIPRKNLQLVGSISLLERAISCAIDSGLFEEICVSTDDEEIAQIAREHGANVPFLRPSELASDESLGIEVIKHAISFYVNRGQNFHSLTLLQPTSPFRDIDQVRLAHSIFDSSPFPSLISVLDVSNLHPSTIYRQMKQISDDCSVIECIVDDKDLVAGSRRQDFDRQYWRNGSIYIVTPDIVMEGQSLLAEPIVSIEMDWIHSINIDEPNDLALARRIAVALGI